MATQLEYTAVANALVPLLQSDFNTMVPAMFRGMIPAGEAAALAGQFAKVAVDRLDAFRKTETAP